MKSHIRKYIVLTSLIIIAAMVAYIFAMNFYNYNKLHSAATAKTGSAKQTVLGSSPANPSGIKGLE